MRSVLAFLLLAGGCASSSTPMSPDLVLTLATPHVGQIVSGLAYADGFAVLDLSGDKKSVRLYLSSDHGDDNATNRAPERLSVAVPIGGSERYPLDGGAAGLLYRNDTLGLDLAQFRGYAWWQQEPDGWQVEINAVSIEAPEIAVRAVFSGGFVDDAVAARDHRPYPDPL